MKVSAWRLAGGFAVLLLSANACAPPREGKSCAPGGFYCSGPKAALECREGQWMAIPCRGPGGCTSKEGAVSCEVHGGIVGDRCALQSEGLGLCSADGKALLHCQDGGMANAQPCDSCGLEGGQVVCRKSVSAR